jgi:hypothetical protein
LILVCDRYTASSIAPAKRKGSTPRWLAGLQKFLPAAFATATPRHRAGDGRYAQGRRPRPLERDLEMQARVRQSYRRQAAEQSWIQLDGRAPRRDRRRRLRTSSAAHRLDHDPRRGERAYLFRSTSFQHPRASRQRRPGGTDIVHEDDDLAAHRARRTSRRERASDIAMPLCRGQVGLGGRGPYPSQRVHHR